MLLVAVRLPNSAQNAYLLVAAVMISLSLIEYSLIFSVENYSSIYIYAFYAIISLNLKQFVSFW